MSATRPLRIFLNYRRDETSGHAGRLYDALVARFDDEHVFMDIDRIEPGLDFTQVITDAVSSCDVVVALIGSQWLNLSDGQGRRRLEKPDDFVRLELEAALSRGVRVIPALVQNADMPSSDDLPRSLHPLAVRHAIELSDTRWPFDVGKLVQTLERVHEQVLAEDEAKFVDAERARREQEEHLRAEAEAETRRQREAKKRADAEAKARRDADAAARRAEREEQRRARDRGRIPIRSWLGDRITLDVGLILGSTIVVLVGSALPWAESKGAGPDIGFVRNFRVPIVALALLVLILLAAFAVRRDLRIAAVMILCASAMGALCLAVIIRLWQERDKWSGVTDLVIDPAVYVVLVGSICLLAASLFAAMRCRRDQHAYGLAARA